MRILIVGSGGREHALAWAVRGADVLFIAPGNPGTEQFGKNIPVQATDLTALVSFARDGKIDLVIIGPEVPLAEGLADALDNVGIPCFGPSAAAAEIESSKAFAKSFMQRHLVPTAQWRHFQSGQINDAKSYAQTLGRCVIKASGLAAGKGAIMCEDTADSERALHDLMIQGSLGDAGKEIVIEEWMEGEEASLFILTDGDDYLLLDSAQDHKRVFDDDQGPNTGGMGAYAPAPVMTQSLIETACSRIIEPVLEG
ncbi:MAG: phosphoribosylamine--glycine ligase, partial [Bacteroidetes bacterium]|nr:phosphoribosylamine--glycine ligase [Bacteroidota bacterium]